MEHQTQAEESTIQEDEQTSFSDRDKLVEMFLRCGGMINFQEFIDMPVEWKAALLEASNRIRIEDMVAFLELMTQGIKDGNG